MVPLPGDKCIASAGALVPSLEERLNGEIKRQTEVVGIFPDEAAITRLIGAILLERNDEWAIQCCDRVPARGVARAAGARSPACLAGWIMRPRRAA